MTLDLLTRIEAALARADGDMKIRVVGYANARYMHDVPIYFRGLERETVEDAVAAFCKAARSRFGETWFAVNTWLSSGPTTKASDFPWRWPELIAACVKTRGCRILNVWPGGQRYETISYEQPHPRAPVSAFSSLAS
mgnify:CR=1 FL=1